jgi:quercetin dioxygenase-like cupin family protein
MKPIAIALVIGLTLSTVATARQSDRFVLAQAAPDDAALAKGVTGKVVLRSTQTASKMPYQYPVGGKPELVAVLVEIEPGGRSTLHQHPVPIVVYVLDGTLTMQAQGGATQEYKTGEAFVEDVNVLHQGFNRTSTPLKLLAVVVKEEGKPATIDAK